MSLILNSATAQCEVKFTGTANKVVDVDKSVLPSQTGNTGKFLVTDGTDASWKDPKEVISLADGKDVTITSPADGQALLYEASTQLWKNKAIVTGITDTGHSFTTNGYQKLSNGLIIQWGRDTTVANNTAQTKNFPITFPNACLMAIGMHSPAGTTATTTNVYNIAVVSNSQYNVFVPSATSFAPVWIAIGY